MRKIVTLLIIALCAHLAGFAQTFTEHIQQKVEGLGTVTVSQSKAIDELVNGKKKTSTPASAQQRNNGYAATGTNQTSQGLNAQQQRQQAGENANANTKASELAAEKKHEAELNTEKQRAEAAKRKEETARNETGGSDDGMSIPTVDMRKKVMRGSHKVTGYRVQAFAGGNSRADKQKAQRIGNAIKMKYPDVPVYVHFYSPRWICRVGNYRSYEQAKVMLKKVRAMGYRSSTIVKGQITVQY